ncbi:hypothetical protein CASFOL_000905 [Castilleja foliolosa]|uniref:Uncharacterized protein n=1 Tax=Castilleja foliolosa TaxID=1961234 RepID=A0ABD3EPG8_9LAMI
MPEVVSPPPGPSDGTDDYVEVAVDIQDGSLVHSITATGDSSDADVAANIKRTTQKLKNLTNLKTGRRLDRTKTAATNALAGLKFISQTDGQADWDGVRGRFHKLTKDTGGLLNRSDFGECIGMIKESKEFALELFDALARRRNKAGEPITIEELRELWIQISDQSFDSRLYTFFDMVDKNEDGRITEDEVKQIISLSASANKLSIIQNKADECARLIMEELDPNNFGYIQIENLRTLFLRAEAETGGHRRKLNKLLSKKLEKTQDSLVRRYYRDCNYFLMDNWRRVWVMVLWVGVMATLFAYKYVEYKNKNDVFGVMGHCVCMAKGGAETLKLNMALILLPVCRNTITWLRNKAGLGVVVPFDDNLNFHKIVATAIAIGVGIHGISHLACDFPRLLNASPEKYEPMKRYFGDQPTSYWYFVKGYEGVTGILMVVLMAIAFTLAFPWFRRSSALVLPKNKTLKKVIEILKKLTGFNAFWYSHHLFVIVYALLILHGIKLYLTHEWYKKTTWMYIVVPVLLYACERLMRAFRSRVKDVEILEVGFPGNVLALHMSKPQGFNYQSGQYIFVKCAAVSPFEWHPFSITSAPRDDYVSVHIRACGDWTKQIRNVFSKASKPPPTGKSGALEAESAERSQGENNPKYPKVVIDGPYGAPTQDYKDYDVVLLVGLGIGTTPMISVIKDIVNNTKAIEDEENAIEEGIITGNDPSLSHSSKPKRKNGSGSNRREFKTRRAYFYWMTREQDTYDWFKGVMNEMAEMDHKGVIEMHNYCTSVYEEGDARSALITMLQSINHAKNGVDIVSGTRVKSHFGRPKWRNVYKQIALDHPNGRVGVFYCGAPQPVKELSRLASEFSQNTNTKFEFHKENF